MLGYRHCYCIICWKLSVSKSKILIGTSWKFAIWVEGVLIIMSYFGIVLMIMFCSLLLSLLRIIKNNYEYIFFAMISILIGFCVDTTFFFPPVLINIFFVLGFFVDYKKNKKLQL